MDSNKVTAISTSIVAIVLLGFAFNKTYNSEKNSKYELEILDDTLLGVSNFETIEQSFGGCTVSGNFKFNIKVPKDFTGIITDPEATYSYKGKDKIDNYSESFVDGISLEGMKIYVYEEEELSEIGQLICSINSSDDIKLKSFSEKIMMFPAIKPILK